MIIYLFFLTWVEIVSLVCGKTGGGGCGNLVPLSRGIFISINSLQLNGKKNI